jgi:hypothetical protein
VPREVELDEVARPRRRERVHADACHVGTENASKRDRRAGIRRGEDVPPCDHAAREPEDVEEDREREGEPADGGQMPEERFERVPERLDVLHGLTIAPPPFSVSALAAM